MDNKYKTCPICEYSFSNCQCKFGDSAHPDKKTQRSSSASFIFVHIIKLEKYWQISYGDDERTNIFNKIKEQYDETCNNKMETKL